MFKENACLPDEIVGIRSGIINSQSIRCESEHGQVNSFFFIRKVHHYENRLLFGGCPVKRFFLLIVIMFNYRV